MQCTFCFCLVCHGSETWLMLLGRCFCLVCHGSETWLMLLGRCFCLVCHGSESWLILIGRFLSCVSWVWDLLLLGRSAIQSCYSASHAVHMVFLSRVSWVWDLLLLGRSTIQSCNSASHGLRRHSALKSCHRTKLGFTSSSKRLSLPLACNTHQGKKLRPMSHLQFSRAILSRKFSCQTKLQV